MLIVISPAKKLDWTARAGSMSTPEFSADAIRLAGVARGLSPADLQKLMKISPDLARLNHDRFHAFQETPPEDVLRPAALAFAGDTYQGLEAASLDAEEMAWAQEHLRILSGLYGLLRPQDAIQPYRLEMGSRLRTDAGKTLYDFWGDRIAKSLRKQAEAIGTDTVVNCASQEYFGAVDTAALGLRIVTPVFMEEKPQGPKIVSFYAKRGRGAMARFIIANRLTSAENLGDFDTGGYVFRPELSKPDQPVFVRPEGAVSTAKAAS